MEEENQQIIRTAVSNEEPKFQNDKELSLTEARLPELEKRGFLVRGDPDKHFKSGKPDPRSIEKVSQRTISIAYIDASALVAIKFSELNSVIFGCKLSEYETVISSNLLEAAYWKQQFGGHVLIEIE